jgi:hypothetical protein
MQTVNAIDNAPVKVRLHRFVNVGDVGHDRADAGLLHAFVCARSHPAAQQRFAIGNRCGHADMTILRGRVKAMSARIGFVRLWGVRFVGEVRVAEFVAPLALHNLPVFDGHHQIIRCATKMLADALFVVSYHGYLHFLFLLNAIST